MKDISAAEFIERQSISPNYQLIDVREVIEYQTFNIGGENIPLGKLLTELEDLELDKNSEIIVICQRGLRSETAKRALKNNGFKQVRNLIGGLLALRKLNS